MRRPTHRIASLGVVLGVAVSMIVALTSTSACLSVEPIDFQPRVRDAAHPDTQIAEVSDADADAPPTCRECIESPDVPGPGCATEVASCRASAKCKQIYECLFEAGCWATSVRKDFIICGLPCAIDAGVVSETDPDALAAIAVAECADPKCGTYCHSGAVAP